MTKKIKVVEDDEKETHFSCDVEPKKLQGFYTKKNLINELKRKHEKNQTYLSYNILLDIYIMLETN